MEPNVNIGEFTNLVEGDTRIVFDTSSLLHLFECAPNLTNKILNNLWKIEDKIWIPNQVYEEYINKKESIKSRELNKFKNVSINYQQQLDKLESEFGKLTLRYKNYDFNGIEELEVGMSESIAELTRKIIEYKNNRNEDDENNRLLLRGEKIESFIKQVVDSGQIGQGFTLRELLDLYKEGEVRYEYQIPPGYKDIVKDKKDTTKRKKYGDLIIWKEVLREARDERKNIILVLEDDKEDWWDLNKIKPRYELEREFKEIVGVEQTFVMVSTTQFNSLLSRMFEDIKGAIESFIEAECEIILINEIENQGWDDLIDLYGDLVSHFIHSGELQPYLEHALNDVEIECYNEPEIEEINVEFKEEHFEIEARFNADIEIWAYSTMGAEFSQQDNATVTINGKIKAQFSIDYTQYVEEFELKELIVENLTIQDMTINESETNMSGDLSDYGLCMDCGQPADYNHSSGQLVCTKCSCHYIPCPGCGRLFDELLDAFCDSCEDR